MNAPALAPIFIAVRILTVLWWFLLVIIVLIGLEHIKSTRSPILTLKKVDWPVELDHRKTGWAIAIRRVTGTALIGVGRWLVAKGSAFML